MTGPPHPSTTRALKAELGSPLCLVALMRRSALNCFRTASWPRRVNLEILVLSSVRIGGNRPTYPDFHTDSMSHPSVMSKPLHLELCHGRLLCQNCYIRTPGSIKTWLSFRRSNLDLVSAVGLTERHRTSIVSDSAGDLLKRPKPSHRAKRPIDTSFIEV